MYFHGRARMMKLVTITKILFLTLFIANCFANESSSQAIPGGDIPPLMDGVEGGESAYFLDENHKPMEDVKEGESAYFLNEDSKPMDNVKANESSSPMVPGGNNYGKTVSGNGSSTQFNPGAPFSGLSSDKYLTYTNEEILANIRDKSKSSLAFEFVQNNFDYVDSRGVYERTFDSDSGAKGGSLHITRDRFLYKGYVNLGYGGGIGVGYSTGKGIFAADGTVSNTRFNLYSLPLDLRLLIEIPVGHFMKLSFAGGPSAMGLIQNRSDRDSGDKDKEKKQVGYGYAAEGKVKFNLSYMFTDTGFEYYTLHEVSFMSLDLVLRTQNYSGFGDDIEITGTSYGLGFTFEFL